jgi:hypothetical protein
MRGDGAFSAHGHRDVRPQLAYAARQVGNHRMKILAVEFSIGLVEHRALADLQQLACSVEFKAAGGGEFIV